MKFLYTLSLLFSSAICFCQPNYKATVLSTDISSVTPYWTGNAVVKENILLFNIEDVNQQQSLYGYNLQNNTINDGETFAPWHSNIPLQKIYEVNGKRIMYSLKDNQLYTFTKDSLVYASSYFNPNNPLGYYIQPISAPDEMFVYKNKLYFQGFVVPSDALSPCGGEAALMTWDGINAPTTAPLVYFGHSFCYTTGIDNDHGSRFFIRNFSIFHDTLFYSGGKKNIGTDYYYLDKNDSSIVAIPKGTNPSDINYVLETYVVGDYMYFWGLQNNGEGGLFKHKGINQLPEKVNIITNTIPTFLNAPFFGDNLFIRSYIDAVAYAYLIHPDGTITEAPNLDGFYDTMGNGKYILSKEGYAEWSYIPISDLTATPLPATELNNLCYNITNITNTIPDEIKIEASNLNYLGVDGDWMFFNQTTYHRTCPDITGLNCDTLLYKSNIVVFGPDDTSAIKAKDPFFEDCNVTYTMDVKHIADCSATDFPSDSKTTGVITLTLTGNQSSYDVTLYRSDDKENWSAVSTITVSGTHTYGGLTKGFYKASIKTNGACIFTTPYYEVKSLIGISKKAVEEFNVYYRLDAYGSLPVNISFITPDDTTETSISFEFIQKYRVYPPSLEGQNLLIHTDLSGCRNVDTFTVGITQRNIKSEFFCDSSRFYFDVVRGVPPFKVTVLDQSMNLKTDTILTETYSTFFHFDKTLHRSRMNALNLIIEDATGEKQYANSFKYTPIISFPLLIAPNCGGAYGSDGQVVARVMQSDLLNNQPYVYSWVDDPSIGIEFPNVTNLSSINISRNISDYSDYTFQVMDTVLGCIYKNTASIIDPYKDYQTDLDSSYEVCSNQNIQIISGKKLWFSPSRNLSISTGVGNTFYFYNSKSTLDSTIYYAPFNTQTGCFASQLDSFTIKNFNPIPIAASDTIICKVGDTISFTAQYEETEWYVDSYNTSDAPLFTGQVFDFKTTSQSHTIYAVLCDAAFDEVQIQYRAINTLQITSDFLDDSIKTCNAITLLAENQDPDAVIHWISPLDTVSGSSSYIIPIPYAAPVYSIQQMGNCKSAASNSIYVDRYILSSPILHVTNDSLYTSTTDSISWYLNGIGIATGKNYLIAQTTGYYQISIQDKNGCTALSDSIFVETKTPSNFCNCIYPIPTHAEITFDYDELESVTLYTSAGAELGTYETKIIDLSLFSSALYIAKIKRLDGSVTFEKVIKY